MVDAVVSKAASLTGMSVRVRLPALSFKSVGGVLGVGIDLVDLDELRTSILNRRGMPTRVFTRRELTYCEGPQRTAKLGARFAAKEAAFKAVGTGWANGVTWRDAEVVARSGKRPELVARGALLEHARALGGTTFQLSLTHSGGYASAVVLLVAD